MPLLRHGRVSTCPRIFSDSGFGDAAASDVIVTLRSFLDDRSSTASRRDDVGVRLRPEDDPRFLASDLDAVSLIEVEFPKYTDGRGYSIAQLLRRRYGYTRELRAVGQVLRDQLSLMRRSGFDAVVFDHPDAEGVYAEAVGELSSAYQGAADDAVTIFLRRRPDASPGGLT